MLLAFATFIKNHFSHRIPWELDPKKLNFKLHIRHLSVRLCQNFMLTVPRFLGTNGTTALIFSSLKRQLIGVFSKSSIDVEMCAVLSKTSLYPIVFVFIGKKIANSIHLFWHDNRILHMDHLAAR